MGVYTGTDGRDGFYWGYLTPGVASDPAGTSPSNASDTLIGLGSDDLLLGYGGNDVLRGGDGNDLLLSGNGKDTLDGGPGKDLIFGEAGADTLTGGPGRDYFFTFDDDRITDFNEEEGDVLNYGVSGATDLLGALRDLFSDLDQII